MDVLVTYDIDTTTRKGQRRLVQVAQVCEGYGIRVQYSVFEFECRVSAAGFQRLIADLRAVIDPGSDRIHLYRFDGELRAARTSLGRDVSHEVGRPWVL